MLFSHSSFKKKHLLTLPHRVGRRGWRRLLRSCLISWACCNSCYLWLQRSATVWLVIVVRQKSNSTCVSSSFRASQQVHKICKLLFFYPFQMISVQHTSIPSSFALVVNTTATRGRCLTTDLNMGCNELLAQATQTALFSDVLFHFALWMRGWLNERSAWSIWKKMFFQSSSFLWSSWSFFFSQTRQKKLSETFWGHLPWEMYDLCFLRALFTARWYGEGVVLSEKGMSLDFVHQPEFSNTMQLLIKRVQVTPT